MARYNEAVSVTFNDNSGDMSWRVNPAAAEDLARYQNIFGVWRARWIMFKNFWRAMRILEVYANSKHDEKPKIWIHKSRIPE